MWAKGKYGVFLDINPRDTELAATLHSPTASNDDQGRVYCRKVKITPLAEVTTQEKQALKNPLRRVLFLELVWLLKEI